MKQLVVNSGLYLLGYIFIVSGLSKVIHIETFADEVAQYGDAYLSSWIIGKSIVMTRAQWKESSGDVNIATYRASTSRQKVRFWQGKFAEVKILNWNEAELEHTYL